MRGVLSGVPRYSTDVILHVIWGPTVRGRPGLAGSLSRCVRTDSRVELCAKPVPTLVEPRTFVQWVLKEQHSHQAFSQWRRHHTDGQSGLPSTALDQVSATERAPMSPPRPWVSVGTIHGQNTSGWPPCTLPPVVSDVRFANKILEFIIEAARVRPRSRRGKLSTIMEPLKIDPVPLGASQIQTHKPSHRCVAVV